MVSSWALPESRTESQREQLRRKIMKAPSRRVVRRDRHTRPQPNDGRRKLRADGIRIRVDEGVVESRERGGPSLEPAPKTHVEPVVTPSGCPSRGLPPGVQS